MIPWFTFCFINFFLSNIIFVDHERAVKSVEYYLLLLVVADERIQVPNTHGLHKPHERINYFFHVILLNKILSRHILRSWTRAFYSSSVVTCVLHCMRFFVRRCVRVVQQQLIALFLFHFSVRAGASVWSWRCEL